MPLQAAAITELTTETATFQILDEWLSDWFDGNQHAVGSEAPVLFPMANRAYGQSAPTQPLHKFDNGADAEIRVVMLPRIELSESNDNILYTGKLNTSFVLFNFWVSAKSPGEGRSEFLAGRIGQLLKSILTNPDSRYDLAEKGITHLQPHAPQWLPSTDYAKRLVACGASLQFPVEFDS